MLILCGKSASGKDTIRKELIKKGMKPVITYTTRPQRKGEIYGKSYYFIDKDDFLNREKQGFFAETTSYNVATGDTWYYGSAIEDEDLSDDKVIILNPEGLKKIKNTDSLNPVSFYITASSNTLWDRLKNRGDNIEEAIRRLNADNEDFAGIDKYVDFTFSNDLGLKPDVIAEIILSTYEKVMANR